MIKIRLPIILSICFIILCVGLTGCVSYKDKADIPENQPSEITKINGESISGTSQPPTDTVQTETSDSSKGSMDTIDYNQYLKKIWVVKSWNGGAYDYSSFFISKIEGGKIEGKLSTRTIAMPDFYYYSLEPSKYLGDLIGTVNNGIAECQFSDKDGNKGKVTLVFKENDEIEGTIKYADKEKLYKEISPDGIFLFRPYNLEDTESFTQFEDLSFTVDLNSWGNVKFVVGMQNGGRHISVEAFLINEDGDILYDFGLAYPSNVFPKNASFQDINNDGLKDMIIIISSSEDDNYGHLARVFFQKNDGAFYNDIKLNREIETNLYGNDIDIKLLMEYLSNKF